jgi:hypothetical protein
MEQEKPKDGTFHDAYLQKREQAAKDQAERERLHKEFKDSLNAIARSPEGVRFIYHLYTVSGFANGPIVSIDNTQKVDTEALLLMTGRMSLYRDIRMMLDPEIRARIEAGFQK